MCYTCGCMDAHQKMGQANITYEDIKRAAAEAGALGCSLSGSGPSLFALCDSRTTADRVAEAMSRAVRTHIGGEPETYVSEVARQGARITSSCDS